MKIELDWTGNKVEILQKRNWRTLFFTKRFYVQINEDKPIYIKKRRSYSLYGQNEQGFNFRFEHKRGFIYQTYSVELNTSRFVFQDTYAKYGRILFVLTSLLLSTLIFGQPLFEDLISLMRKRYISVTFSRHQARPHFTSIKSKRIDYKGTYWTGSLIKEKYRCSFSIKNRGNEGKVVILVNFKKKVNGGFALIETKEKSIWLGDYEEIKTFVDSNWLKPGTVQCEASASSIPVLIRR
jgi:hypothetical protein